MAIEPAAVRKAYPLAALIFAAALATPALAQRKLKLPAPHGTTEGLFSESPSWAAGVQLGNYGATGVTVQKVGFLEGALNLGLGLAYGSATASADYAAIFSSSFRRRALSNQDGFNTIRGELNPYAGAGIQIGRGASIRIPVGLQYTMLKDPVSFFGGAALLYGRFFSDEDLGAQAWFMLGARALL